MSITDELREYVRHYSVAGSSKDKTLTAIADRIDEAHKHAIAYVDDRDPETMAEHGWVKLPLDADGVPIHVGDVVRYYSTAKKERVVWVAFGEGGVLHVNTNGGSYTHPEQLRHCYEPTVEDVLREFSCVLMGKQEFDGDVTDAIAEYAAKLRLKEGEDA